MVKKQKPEEVRKDIKMNVGYSCFFVLAVVVICILAFYSYVVWISGRY